MRPVCPICKSEHFAREQHVFKADVPSLEKVLRVANVPSKVANAVANAIQERVVFTEIEPVGNKHGKYVDKERRAKYMREYMKAKRAIDSGRAKPIRGG